MTNTTAHTPGPWSIWQPEGKRGYGTAKKSIIKGSKGYPLAEAELHHAGSGPEANANARLIAAAPELLDALVDALDYLAPDHNNGHAGEWTDAMIERCKEAIAKATGKEAA